MSDKYYELHITNNGGKVRVKIIEECPIVHTRKGQCSGCDLFAGINPKLSSIGLCKASQLRMNIDYFRSPRHCPDEKGTGECTQCKKFLGFSNNSGFYCSAHTKTKDTKQW